MTEKKLGLFDGKWWQRQQHSSVFIEGRFWFRQFVNKASNMAAARKTNSTHPYTAWRGMAKECLCWTHYLHLKFLTVNVHRCIYKYRDCCSGMMSSLYGFKDTSTSWKRKRHWLNFLILLVHYKCPVAGERSAGVAPEVNLRENIQCINYSQWGGYRLSTSLLTIWSLFFRPQSPIFVNILGGHLSLHWFPNF